MLYFLHDERAWQLVGWVAHMFEKLPMGIRLRAQYGDICVISEIGGGSQGDVYKIRYNGEDKALKWYRGNSFYDRDKFIINLRKNVMRGAPSDEFLWPIDFTDEMEDGCFGYVMDLCPHGFCQADDVLLRPSLFPSFKRAIDVCLNVVHAFRRLHTAGYVYRDISAGNFFINPKNGRVLICDNDNVAPEGSDSGIRGTPRFMAPEIVVNNEEPTEKSDRHSLSVIIFYLLLTQHPLEGRLADIFDAETQRRLYGTHPLFIFDPQDRSNAPRQAVCNACVIWDSLPAHMREMFVRAFSHDALMQPSHRPTEIEWIRQLVRLRSEVVTCPECGRSELFLQDARPVRCDHPACGCMASVPLRLELPIMRYALPVVDDMRIYSCQTNIVSDALTALDPVLWVRTMGDGSFAMKNNSRRPWGVTAGGRTYDVAAGQAIAVRPGMELSLGQQRARILLNGA